MDDSLIDPIRASYDAVADAYAANLSDELSYKPFDRALLRMLVEEAGERPVADLGCGPGHVAAWMATEGASAVGIDLSPGMVAVATRDYPGAHFRVGDLCDLPASDGEFGAAAVLYSFIHLDVAQLPLACAELLRVLAPGAPALISFHIGEEIRHRTEWWDQEVDLRVHFFSLDVVAAVLAGAGLIVEARMERVAYPLEFDTRRGYVLARRPA